MTNSNTLPAAIHHAAAERAMAAMTDGRGRAIVPISGADTADIVAIEVESGETRIATREISRQGAETMLISMTAIARNMAVTAERRCHAMTARDALQTALNA